MTAVMHFQLTGREHEILRGDVGSGASFDRPEMLCRTGDGHAQGTRLLKQVTCPQCLQTLKTFLPYIGE